MRPRVLVYLKQLEARNGRATVLDVGGAANPWCDEFVTTYVDLQDVPTDREVIRGDLCDAAFRESFNGRRWDFALCTHVLEDLRDPLPVVLWMQRIAAAGFVAVPNKHTELSAVESPQYPGYYHHRWVFTLDGSRLQAVAKLPLLGYYRQSNRWLHRLQTAGCLTRRVARFLAPGALPGGMFPWFDAAKAAHGLELGFMWEESFDFCYCDGDYCGPDRETMQRRYEERLSTGI